MAFTIGTIRDGCSLNATIFLRNAVTSAAISAIGTRNPIRVGVFSAIDVDPDRLRSLDLLNWNTRVDQRSWQLVVRITLGVLFLGIIPPKKKIPLRLTKVATCEVLLKLLAAFPGLNWRPEMYTAHQCSSWRRVPMI